MPCYIKPAPQAGTPKNAGDRPRLCIDRPAATAKRRRWAQFVRFLGPIFFIYSAKNPPAVIIYYKVKGDDEGAGKQVADLPADQKLETTSNDHAKPAQDRPFTIDLTPNVVMKPTPTAGLTAVKPQHNGMRVLGEHKIPVSLPVAGDYYYKLKTWLLENPFSSDYPFGRFGVYFPAAPRLGFRPTATVGAHLADLHVTYLPWAKRIDCDITLRIAGTMPLPEETYDARA